MKKHKILFFIIPVLVFAVSCKSSTKEQSVSLEMAATNDQMAPPPPPAALSRGAESSESEPSLYGNVYDPSTVDRKIIRDASMEIRVNDIEKAKNKVDTLVKKFRAYYSNESRNNTDYLRGYSLTIRVPAASFDAFLSAIEKGDGEVAYKNITSRDVTEEFIDIETRLANKKAYIKRYNELLKQAKSVKDILEIQDKMRIIEEEVESATGRLKYLRNQVDYSTLTLQITRKNDFNVYSRDNYGSFFDKLKRSLVKGWFGFISFVLFLIRIWPFWIISGIVFYFVRRLIRSRRKKNGISR